MNEATIEKQLKERASKARQLLRLRVLAQLDAYMAEAEHQDGYAYWSSFPTVEDTYQDFLLYEYTRTSPGTPTANKEA